MADVPDTRVRLSAEGLAELIAGLQKVRAEAQKTANETGKSFEGMNAILEKGTQLLELFGVTVGVVGLIELTKRGAEAASTLEDLASSTSLSTEELQALMATATQAGVRTEKLVSNLDNFQRKLDDLQSGDEKTQGVFKRLGLDPQDLKGKSVAESIDIVADAMAQLRSGSAKTAIANDLFGKSGARLIPVMNKLAGSGGIGGVTKAAEEAGLALDEGTIAAAARVENQLHTLQQQSTNLAIVFASELGPALIDGLKAAGNELVNLQGEIHDLGPGIRFLIDLATGGIIIIAGIADPIFATFKAIITALVGATTAGIALLAGEANQAKSIWENTNRQIEEIQIGVEERQQKRRTELGGLFNRAQTVIPQAGGGTGTAPPDPDKAARDRIAVQRALADNELKISQQLNKAQQDLEKRRFEDGLSSLQDYYSRRRFLIESAAAAEISTLERRLAAEKQNPDDATRRVNVANIEAEIARRKLALETDIKVTFHDQQLEFEQLEKRQRTFDDRVLEAQGRRHEQVLRDIREEAVELSKLETQRGVPDPKALEDINARQKLLIDAEEFQHQQEILGRALADLDRERALIQAQVEKGTLSELDGKKQIAAIEQARIPNLEAIAALVLQAAEATGNEESIAQARQLQAQIAAIGTTVSDTQRLMTNFGDAAEQALAGGITSALTDVSHGFENLGQVGVSAVQSIINSLLALEAQLIASKILDFLAGGIGSVSGGSSRAGGASGAPRGGLAPKRFAGGGYIRGPGTPTSDSVPLWGSDKEFMTRAKAVAQPGVLPLLSFINEHAPSFDQIVEMIASPVNPDLDPIRIQAKRIPRFAEGGLVTAGAGGSSTVGGTIGISLDDGLIEAFIESPRGQKVMLKTMSRRPRSFNRALGRN